MTALGTLFCVVGICASFGSVPPAPTREEWSFREDLARPEVCHAREAYRVVDSYGLGGDTETVCSDLARFMESAPNPAAKTLFLRKGEVCGHESYDVSVATNGDVTLTADDDDGIRRAVCWFEDRVAAGDLRSVRRQPWLRNRISRCFFSPIKRPPFNRDELMDDVDYYPEAYLNRLAHEGINGLWLTIELSDLVQTSFNPRAKDAERRLAKLRRTVAQCRRYGICIWVFCIEPKAVDPDGPLAKALPCEAVGARFWNGRNVLCPSVPEVRRYLEEAFEDLFRQVPGLAGAINISHGERPTTCLSAISPVTGCGLSCPRCARLAPWQIHGQTASSMVVGMRRASPGAELISWFYHPQVEFERAPWVADVTRHLPDGVTMLYNFESGAVRNQLGRYRAGGDYWLSYVGPSPSFSRVAEAGRSAEASFGAKVQVGCSHECATVPFVPVPGLLYRKYAAMRAAGCSTVMQCWYFGNYPGVMNKAAGELSFSDFSETEDEFLLRLARPEWGSSASLVRDVWRRLSDAYAEYPLSNDMQYYGPFHSGVAWPLLPAISMRRLGRTWKPLDPPSGDVIGECLENHSLDEACVLARRMCQLSDVRMPDGEDALTVLSKRFRGDADRLADVGVMRALQLIFASASDVFEFYRLREQAVVSSRQTGDVRSAETAVKGMQEIVGREVRITREMRDLSAADSRLGFHSEAETHQFYPRKLDWRLGQLDEAQQELRMIAAEIGAGRPYPQSEHERTAPCVRLGETVVTRDGFRFAFSRQDDGSLKVEGFSPTRKSVSLRMFNLCVTAWPQTLTFSPKGYDVPKTNIVSPAVEVTDYRARMEDDGFAFAFVLDARSWSALPARQPHWIIFSCEDVFDLKSSRVFWPEGKAFPQESRLNHRFVRPEQFGRILW